MRKIELSKQAAEFLKELPTKPARQISQKIKQLQLDPSALPSEMLKGYAPMRRLKSGEFRVIFDIDEAYVRIRLIGKRNDNDVYKALERMVRR